MPPLALVTGASSGLGLEFARLLARDGHELILVARHVEAMDSLRHELIRDYDARVDLVPCDLARREERDRLGALVAADPRGVDVLVNNAGIGLHGAFAETELDTELRMVDLNVAAVVHLAKLVLPGMLARRRGRILNVASVAAFMPGPLMSVYYASKAFVLSWSLALSEETDGTGVTATAFCPGTVITNFQRTAGLDPSGAAKVPTLMDAETAARHGYRAMMRGERLIIPGRKNRQLVFLTRLAPRSTVTRMVRRVQEARRRATTG